MEGHRHPWSPRRRQWIVFVVAAAVLHTVVIRMLLAARGHATAAAIATDIELLTVCSIATWTCWRTARGRAERHLRIAWLSITAGIGMWWIAGLAWSYREIVLGVIAPAPSLLDAPFFALAPTFAFALIFYRRLRLPRALQIRQLADIGILAATIMLFGTLVLAVPLRSTAGEPYVYIAIGYPGLYLAVVLAAFVTLGGHAWGPQRVVLGLLVCAHLMFAVVDLLYGAKVLVDRDQTEVEDTLWLVGMLLLIWAARQERSLQVLPRSFVDAREPSAGNAIVGAVVIVVLGALGEVVIVALGGLEWTVMSLAVVLLAGCIGLRVWAGGCLEDAWCRAHALRISGRRGPPLRPAAHGHAPAAAPSVPRESPPHRCAPSGNTTGGRERLSRALRVDGRCRARPPRHPELLRGRARAPLTNGPCSCSSPTRSLSSSPALSAPSSCSSRATTPMPPIRSCARAPASRSTSARARCRRRGGTGPADRGRRAGGPR